jgi:hypothetical protein
MSKLTGPAAEVARLKLADARDAYDTAKRAHAAATTAAAKKTALDAMSKAANEISGFKSQLGHKK